MNSMSLLSEIYRQDPETCLSILKARGQEDSIAIAALLQKKVRINSGSEAPLTTINDITVTSFAENVKSLQRISRNFSEVNNDDELVYNNDLKAIMFDGISF